MIAFVVFIMADAFNLLTVLRPRRIWTPRRLLFRRRNGARRKNRGRGEVRWQLAGQVLKERDNVARVSIAQGHPELHARHDLYGFRPLTRHESRAASSLRC